MSEILDCLIDAGLDTLKILPYLLLTFIILELFEHKYALKNETILSNNKKYGPLLGGVLGALPQCGISSMAANLFSKRVITIGTLIAVFLSTSDEMLPIMISEHASFLLLLKIVSFKVLIGIIMGYLIDLTYKKKNDFYLKNISEMCEEDHCKCEKDGVLLSSIKHALKTGAFILIANIMINLIIVNIGEDNISNFLLNKNVFTYFISSIVGLIPNCASSIIITKLYLSNLITIGNLLSGLLTGSGIGILLLFRTNKNFKENISILLIIYSIGVILGMMVDLLI